ncbi:MULTISPECIES: hypothetical protein [unclassified Rathayibacter]|uniref:hypothetical protein n=1 Tax=unclassified Rathayibacter TaxID=2609250 RepID=UPI00188AA61A|nr:MULTISPECIES: hypothetical protein [unclassified Rathayibacter]MBF4461365.1 hypothetical protein [Rathayibacter sp. VKM Ac-2879]MBF4502776.1 hypothetical protein [Rathayibacter sp. VKM Ac-2878]
MTAPDDEGTLLELVRAAESGPRTLGSVRERIRRTHRLSASYLGLGFITMATLLIVRGVVSYLWALDERSATWWSGVAWLLVIGALACAVVVALARHGELPRAAFVAVLAVDVLALGLEFADYALPEPSAVYYPSVCVGVGATVLAVLSYQPLSRSFAALGLLVGLSALGLLGHTLLGGSSAALAVSNVLLAVAPTAVCAALLTTLDRHVHRKLDRTLAESVVDGPSVRPGSLAASELSHVDARVEELLEQVTRRSPRAALDERLGERARVLGDELREALARSHDETWLRIAVAESAVLSTAVSVSDPEGRAARLLPPDRSRLLSVLWLLTAPTTRPSIELALTGGADGALSIGVTAVGLRARDLDPAVWGILSELGEHRVGAEGHSTTVRLVHLPGRRAGE